MRNYQKYISGYLDKISIMLLIYPFLHFCAIILLRNVPDVITLGDYAVLETTTRNLFTNRILLGPYSRFLFFHPGPLYFLLRYPIYTLFGYRSSAFFLVSALISSGSLFYAWSIIRRELGRSFAFAFSSVMILFLFHMDTSVYLSDWNPHIIIFPLLLFCISISSFATREMKYLLITVLSGSLVAQTHISGIPTLGILSLLSLVVLIYPRILVSFSVSLKSIPYTRIFISLALLLLLWLPTIYEQITAVDKGNVSRIITIFTDNDPGISFQEAFNAWSGKITDFELKTLSQKYQNSHYVFYLKVAVIAFRLFLLSIAYGLLRRKGRCGFLCILIYVCFVFHGATLYSTTQIRGHLFPFLVEWMIILGPLSVFTILASFYVVFREYISRNAMIKLAIFIVLPISAYLSVLHSLKTMDYCNLYIYQSRESDLGVETLTNGLADYINIRNSEACYLFKLDKWDNWRLMVSIVNRLDKEGYTIRMDNNIWYKCPHLPPDITTHTLQFVDLDSIGVSDIQIITSFGRVGIFQE